MPRKRQIKPSIFANEELGAETTDPLMMVLFEAMWCLADREGRLDDRPAKIVKGFAFPYRTIEDPESMVQWLHEHNFIVRYWVHGKRYIQIVNFKQHQTGSGIHPNEVASVIPPIPIDTVGTTKVNRTDDLGAPSRSTLAHSTRASSSSSSFPSFPSFPSLENGAAVAAVDTAPLSDTAQQETDPVERRIWQDGVELLKRSQMTKAQAQPLLGRLAQQYSKRSLAEAIAVTQAENPADPKAFLIGVLKQRSSPNPDLMVGKSRDDGVDPALLCGVCFDTGEVSEHDPNGEYSFSMRRVPCPEAVHRSDASQ